MRLRARLSVTVLIAALPVVAGVAWLKARYEWKTADRALVDYAITRITQDGGRELCEQNPASFPPGTGRREPPSDAGGPPGPGRRGEDPRPPPEPRRHDAREPREPGGRDPRNELWAYASDFRSANPDAPVFPDELQRALASGARSASTAFEQPDRDGIQVAVRMDWTDGPCVIVLVRRAELGYADSVRDLVLGSTAVCVALLATVLFAAGPIVERVRRLTTQVRVSAASRYATLTNVEGSDEISELAGAFNSAATDVKTNLDALEARERMLRTFVENTTHDVMLPLTVLQGHLTTLRRMAEAGAPVGTDVVVDALQEAHYMASLIQNLTAATRLDGGAPAVERHRLDLNALVERCIARHAPIARAGQIQLEHAVPPAPIWIEGDVTLVEQAVSNLIHNAVRYVEPGGHVAVVLEERGGEFSLRVLDDGPGIPAELATKVFERSFRTDAARTRHPSGSGLGLSIAKQVAECHGFELALRRPAAAGSEIELRGPRITLES